jgi:hypothetical protein
METFPTHTPQHRGHDGNPPAGRRGTLKNKTWVSGERLEERERYYQEVSPSTVMMRRPAKKQGDLRAINLAR